jgi:ADP-ribose pyrophosphatase YjhB (NUDIX family)
LSLPDLTTGGSPAIIHVLKPKVPEKALPVAVAAIFSSHGVLLIKRDKPPFVGLWGLPGGKIHYGEHLDEAVKREVLEETGLRPAFLGLCGVVTEKLYHGDRLKMHYLLLVCDLFSRSTRLRRSPEGDLRWFSLGYLEKHGDEVIPSDQRILKKLVLRQPRRFYYRCCVRKRGRDYYVETFK